MKPVVFSIAVAVTLAVFTPDCSAQGIRNGRGGGIRNRAGGSTQLNLETNNRRQDVEGTIWEFKVIDDKTKKTTMTGKIRIKQSSIFAVGKVKIVGEEDKKQQEKANAGKGGSGNFRKQFQGLLSQRTGQALDETSGGDRIGDVSKGSTKHRYEFDEDDDYPLSGLVEVKPDTKKKNGVYSGLYHEMSGGRKVEGYRFEMRKIEE